MRKLPTPTEAAERALAVMDAVRVENQQALIAEATDETIEGLAAESILLDDVWRQHRSRFAAALRAAMEA